jgi:putative nucleotidyltransferase with HDIG domain
MAAGSIAEPELRLPEWLRAALQARLAEEVGLPVLPATACRVMAACQEERSELGELAELVTHDQALAAHVLRVANSVAYAPKAPILSLRQALTRLGLSTVSDIAIALAIRQRVFSVPGHEDRIRQLWLHSTATACYAQDVALLLKHDMEHAFLCGLLHDVGMPIVMQAICDLVRAGSCGPVPPAVMEAAMREFHCAFGGRMAQRWRLGPQVSTAIYHHHDPAGAHDLYEGVLIVTLADALACWASDDTQGEEDFRLEGPAGDGAGLSPEQVQALLGSRARILEHASAFQ